MNKDDDDLYSWERGDQNGDPSWFVLLLIAIIIVAVAKCSFSPEPKPVPKPINTTTICCSH